MRELAPTPRGRIRLRVQSPVGPPRLGLWRPNLILYDWGPAVAKLFAGDIRYKVAAMYLEFENVADPEDAVSVPAFDRGPGSGREYFAALTGTRDYLRVPLRATVTEVSDAELWSLGNQNTYLALSQGSVGEHGLAFDADSNSKLLGGGLVVTPDFDDPDQDLVIARAYLPVDEQYVKQAAGQPGLDWEHIYG